MRSESVVAERGAEKVAFPGGRWALKSSPFKSTKPAPRPPVQGELSLEKVKPVRNDLNDCDLELVPREAVEAAPVKSGAEEIPVVKVQPFWARVRSWFRRKQ